MEHPLLKRLPRDQNASNDDLLGAFLDYVSERGLELYPSQEEAILELFEEKNVILNTPTGSGKSLVAAALHFKALAQGRRSIYTCPIKALVNEKFLALCRDFGPEQVGMSTGDATVNRDAPILCCTAEILSNIALRNGDQAWVDDVIMDEFHYYSDRERGVAWQVPLLTLPQARFLLMSATLGDTAFFEEELTKLTDRPSVTIQSNLRPVPLEFRYSEQVLAETLEELVAQGQAPVYVVHFSQMEAAESAQDFMSQNFCTRDEKEKLARALDDVDFSTPYGPEIRRWLKHGVALHHAGLLPRYRVLVEQLAQRNLLKVICGTDTLGVGINVPIRTVLFTRLCKFDGQKVTILSARDFHQISGRAGRKGFDDRGWVVVQAPEHVIENLKLEQKAGGDSAKLRKIVKRKPPERGYIVWDKNTFARLIAASPERLVSRFQVSHGMLLNVLSREGDSCGAMRELIRACHDSPNAKTGHRKRAWQLFRALVDRQIIEFVPPDEDGTYLRVNIDLQEDFSLDQALSLYLLDTLQLIDPESPNYALDLLTLVESILEDPESILRRQLDRLKSEKVAEMKAEGLDYDRRMEELEKLEYPKPIREFVYSTFNEFAAKHPWIGQENIRPKSIAREMFEGFRSFEDYVRDYELERIEGLLLRHLSSVYKVLIQTVPEARKNETVREMELFFEHIIRQTDSSLLDEWERLRDPAYEARRLEEGPAHPRANEERPDITRNREGFLRLLRQSIFDFLRPVANGDYERALATLEFLKDVDGREWTKEALETALAPYYEAHERICLDPEARNRRHTHLNEDEAPVSWLVQQVLVDPEGANDWALEFRVNLRDSRDANRPILQLLRVVDLTKV